MLSMANEIITCNSTKSDDVKDIEKAIELYEQQPVVIKYLNLKRKLKSITKSHSKVEKLRDDVLYRICY